MDAKELRSAFTDFFVERGHTRVPSASLIPVDPTLMFTVAGMVPFKPYFLGEEIPPYRRAVSVQKCVRAGGKHNDLDEIGRTKRHLTFFEMMGNFSFGEYFKELAIPYAWDFVTNSLGFDPERLWVTVHLSDDDAAEIWRDVVGVRPERIQRLDADNFWQAGDTGPCGPCSEIFFDKGPEFGSDGGPEHGGDERFLEFWNLVFMQYDRSADGVQTTLPKPSIDTGAGLERILTLAQGVDSVFDIDEFVALRQRAEAASGVVYGRDPDHDVSLRILVDHARATTFLVSDGVFPSNEGRGYVLRRILRRAVRHAYLLGVSRPVMAELVDGVVDVMGSSYPELDRSHDFVKGVIAREEDRFRHTLKTGSVLLDDRLAELGGSTELDGDTAFMLHDTYGFPLEVTQEITAERGITVDVAGFETAMNSQRTRAKAARKGVAADEHFDVYHELIEQFGPTDNVSRSTTEANGRVLAIVGEYLVLDRTPFYAESGGQVGDTGVMRSQTGAVRILDTTLALPELVRHRFETIEGTVRIGQEVEAEVDVSRRDAIRRNHTGTHVLHHALRKVLGEHVRQQGSHVGPERLRFDFSHYESVTDSQMAEIEDLVAAEVLSNAPVRAFETTKSHAEELGALAFFGDKYGDVVRVVEAGSAVELCGGTHVRQLGDIGTVKVVAEGSIGSNIRRVEAITGFNTLTRLRTIESTLKVLADRVNVPAEELLEGVERRLAELKAAQAEIKELRRQLSGGAADALLASALNGQIVARVDGVARDDLREMAMSLRSREGIDVVVLAGEADGGGVALVAAVRKESGFHAGELISDAATLIKGGGGKGADFAMAGGKEPSGIDPALADVRQALGHPA